MMDDNIEYSLSQVVIMRLEYDCLIVVKSKMLENF